MTGDSQRRAGDSQRADRAVRAVRRGPDAHCDLASWPATVPAVAQLLRDGLELPAGVTVLVGENGSGKSTLIGILAEACGLSPHGGSPLGRFAGAPGTAPGIGSRLVVERGPGGPRWSYFLRADTMHGLYSYLAEHPGQHREASFHQLSHGEGFLEILRTRVSEPGFYLLDEPDAPLSFVACLGLLALLHDLAAGGSQAVVATHSPLIAALPGARILELGDWGIRPASWEQLQVVSHWRQFLADPGSYFRHLLG
jgi:predicted ATPase